MTTRDSAFFDRFSLLVLSASLLAAIAPSLPFEMTQDHLAIGEHGFEGRGVQLVVVVPARVADEKGPGHPEFLLYAGTGEVGVGEINATAKGQEPIFVSDAFGKAVAGTWKTNDDGSLGTCETADEAFGVHVTLATPSGRKLVLEIRVSLRKGGDSLDRRTRQRRTAEIGVDDDPGCVDHTAQRRGVFRVQAADQGLLDRQRDIRRCLALRHARAQTVGLGTQGVDDRRVTESLFERPHCRPLPKLFDGGNVSISHLLVRGSSLVTRCS